MARPQWCALPQASMAATQRGCSARKPRTFSRESFLRNPTPPSASAPCAWKDRFARSRPIMLTFPMDALSVRGMRKHHHLAPRDAVRRGIHSINYGRSFALRGHTPVVRRPAKRFSQSMISSLTNRGKLRFMIYEGALKAPIFLNFLRRLVREAVRKLFVIVDNLPVHRAHRVTAWVQDHADRIELCYLPSYAPEHNPDEFLNNDLKQAMARRRTPRDKAALKSGLTSYMRSLQQCPAKVRAFFQAPTVRYAA